MKKITLTTMVVTALVGLSGCEKSPKDYVAAAKEAEEKMTVAATARDVEGMKEAQEEYQAAKEAYYAATGNPEDAEEYMGRWENVNDRSPIQAVTLSPDTVTYAMKDGEEHKVGFPKGVQFYKGFPGKVGDHDEVQYPRDDELPDANFKVMPSGKLYHQVKGLTLWLKPVSE